ncbi:MAG: roadblock/LC7 domain-containing protein [Verrucomicrobia bacterium]|nr:roadblock/LC7 domain-containing protein [Verrucomicrobiota bacterium]
MGTTPHLNNEDAQRIGAVLNDFLAKSEADAVLLVSQGGFLVFQAGRTAGLDLQAIAALVEGAFAALQAMSTCIGESNFNSFYQQGEKRSLLVAPVEQYHGLIVLFPAQASLGAVKFYAAEMAPLIAQQLAKARATDPEGIDPISLNLTDTTQIFKRK